MNFKQSLILVALGLCASTLASAENKSPVDGGFPNYPWPGDANQAAITSASTVQAVGEAEILVEPTKADYSMILVSKAATVAAAQSANAKQSAKVMEALTGKYKLLQADIRNNVSTEKVVKYVRNSAGDSNAVDDGYKVTNFITATVKDLPTLGVMIDDMGALGAETRYISYGLIDRKTPKAQALEAATRDALANATSLLRGLGKKPGYLLAVMPVGAQPYRSGPTPMAAAAPRSPEGGGATSVSSGLISVTATVEVVFTIENN